MSLAVWHYVDSSKPGGIESHLRNLLPALCDAGINAQLILHTDYGPHPLKDALEQAGVAWRCLDGRFGTLFRALRRERPALLHTHGYKAGILGRLAGRVSGIPVVSTMHSGDLGSGPVRAYSLLDHYTSGLSHLIVVSAALRKRYPRARLIANGVAMPETRHAKPGHKIAFVGRLSEEKGPFEFVKLAERVPGENYVMFGDGPLRQEAAARAGGSVQFVGAVPDMAPHWADIGLLVMPSRFEGMPMAALEAMAHGIPVAAYAVGALPELLADNRGLLAPPGDLDALDAALRQFVGMSPEQRRIMGDQARAHVQAHYSAEACARATTAVYRDVLGARAERLCPA